VSSPAVIAAGGLTLIRAAGGGHRIELRDDAGAGALIARLESIEPGDAVAPDSVLKDSANWPFSPPVQEWHDETRGSATVLMAVGRAGRSHWSLSCEVSPDGLLAFDVAARISEPPVRLGSSYRLLDGAPQQISAERLQLADGWQFTVDSLTTQLRYDVASRTITLRPVIERKSPWPHTVRWTYVIETRPTS